MQYFSESVTNLKDTKTSPNYNIFELQQKTRTPLKNVLPDELIINGQQFTNSHEIAIKINDYFALVSDLLK